MAAPEEAMAVNKVATIDDWVRVTTVLASVSDKSGLDFLARGLLRANPALTILSTGGTFSALQQSVGNEAASRLKQVSEYTGQPEMQGGLVKTLDFKIYLGLLSETYNPAHAADLERTSASPIDMVVVNLYPFEKTVATPGTTLEDARANIDIGGPCMVRAAAKNFHRVAVLADPADYPAVLEELSGHGGALCLATRYRLAQKAFRLIARYDEAIADYLAGVSRADVPGLYEVRSGR
jgi:phosphoribosylaminoimidazolecarboxamide formyltransferase / IMP cyclohydrolase